MQAGGSAYKDRLVRVGGEQFAALGANQDHILDALVELAPAEDFWLQAEHHPGPDGFVTAGVAGAQPGPLVHVGADGMPDAPAVITVIALIEIVFPGAHDAVRLDLDGSHFAVTHHFGKLLDDAGQHRPGLQAVGQGVFHEEGAPEIGLVALVGDPEIEGDHAQRLDDLLRVPAHIRVAVPVDTANARGKGGGDAALCHLGKHFNFHIQDPHADLDKAGHLVHDLHGHAGGFPHQAQFVFVFHGGDLVPVGLR